MRDKRNLNAEQWTTTYRRILRCIRASTTFESIPSAVNQHVFYLFLCLWSFGIHNEKRFTFLCNGCKRSQATIAYQSQFVLGMLGEWETGWRRCLNKVITRLFSHLAIIILFLDLFFAPLTTTPSMARWAPFLAALKIANDAINPIFECWNGKTTEGKFYEPFGYLLSDSLFYIAPRALGFHSILCSVRRKSDNRPTLVSLLVSNAALFALRNGNTPLHPL